MVDTVPDKIEKIYKTTDNVFIVGGGYSLFGFDFERIRDKNVIVVNESFRYVPTYQAMVAIDINLMFERDNHLNAPYFEKLGQTPIYTNHATQCGYGLNFKWIYHEKHGGFSFTDSYLTCGSNSGYMAINVAYHMGARNIYLLGYDMGRIDGVHKYWWNPEYKEESGLHTNYDYTFNWWDEMAKELEGHDELKIWNCSPDSKLKIFPKISLNEIPC